MCSEAAAPGRAAQRGCCVDDRVRARARGRPAHAQPGPRAARHELPARRSGVHHPEWAAAHRAAQHQHQPGQGRHALRRGCGRGSGRQVRAGPPARAPDLPAPHRRGRQGPDPRQSPEQGRPLLQRLYHLGRDPLHHGGRQLDGVGAAGARVRAHGLALHALRRGAVRARAGGRAQRDTLALEPGRPGHRDPAPRDLRRRACVRALHRRQRHRDREHHQRRRVSLLRGSLCARPRHPGGQRQRRRQQGRRSGRPAVRRHDQARAAPAHGDPATQPARHGQPPRARRLRGHGRDRVPGHAVCRGPGHCPAAPHVRVQGSPARAHDEARLHHRGQHRHHRRGARPARGGRAVNARSGPARQGREALLRRRGRIPARDARRGRALDHAHAAPGSALVRGRAIPARGRDLHGLPPVREPRPVHHPRASRTSTPSPASTWWRTRPSCSTAAPVTSST